MNLNPFAAKDVASVVKQFTKAVEELNAVADANNKEAFVKTDKITALNKEVEAHKEEVAAAMRVRQNLEKLLNG
jgi:Sec-independent protein translocase protein TatA